LINQNLSIADNQQYLTLPKSLEKLGPKVKILSTGKCFCDKEFCYMARNKKLLYRDLNHLNLNGVKYLVEKIIKDNPEIVTALSK
jgi:hypothetical protein